MRLISEQFVEIAYFVADLLVFKLGMCGKQNIFKGYIELELQLGEVDRCRQIYLKYVQSVPHQCDTWQSFAQLEASVGEAARAR